MSEFVPGIPAEVVKISRQAGVHEACLLASDVACDDCVQTIIASFEQVYGALPDEYAVFGAILDDLRKEAQA